MLMPSTSLLIQFLLLLATFSVTSVTSFILADDGNIFQAPRFSLQIGDFDSWNCNQVDLEVVFFGRNLPLCNENIPSIEGETDGNLFDTVIAVFDSFLIGDCPEEEMLLNAERLNANAFLHIRNNLPGSSLNVHNLHQPVGVGGIPFLEVGNDFHKAFAKEIEVGNLESFRTGVIIDIIDCDDENPFFFVVNRVHIGISAIIALLYFFGAWSALDGYRKLSPAALTQPRRVALAIDGSIFLVNGIFILFGMCKSKSFSTSRTLL